MTYARSQAQNRKKFRPKATLRTFLRDEAGASAVLIVLTIATTVGVIGLGVESGMWQSERRQYQTAADAGAIAGAWSLATALTANNQSTFSVVTDSTGPAWRETVRNGATDSADNVSVTYDSANKKITVIVTQPKESLISNVAWSNGVTIMTQASAAASAIGSPCILALSPTGTGVKISGNVTLAGTKCAVSANSTDSQSVVVQGNATVDPLIQTAGGIDYNGQPQTSLASTGVGSMQNPFSRLTVGTAPTPCTAWNASAPGNLGTDGGVTTLCKNNSSNQTGGVTLSGGMSNGACTTPHWVLHGTIYVYNGDFTVQGNTCVTTGSTGATLILTGSPSAKIGSIKIGANSIVTLVAPTSGTYSGISVYQDPNAPASNPGNGNNTNVFNGGTGLTITGAIYTPAETVSWGGNNSTNCTVVVAKVININGDSYLNSDYSQCQQAGVNLTQIYQVSLLE